MRKSLLSASVVLWAGVIVIPSAEAQPASDSAVEAKIQDVENNIAPAFLIKGQDGSHITLASRMAALHVPGVSIAVIHNGTIEWAKGFGVTKLEGPAVTPNTLFQAGSISKPVTAMAILHLAQSGRLSLDTDVNQYLKTWKVPENSFTAQKKVTLRGLLSHTAGVTVHGFPGYASGDPVPTLVQVLNGEKPANTPPIRVDTVPGTIWRYSGGGYVITQQLLLDLTGKSFPSFMQETVLGPLGMSHSTYEQPLPATRQADAATPYDQHGAPIVGGAHTYPEMAPAGLWTTPSDLARYAIEVQKSLTGQSNSVLSKTTASEMVKDVGLGNYGLGLQVGGSPDHTYFEHGGVDEGFVSNLIAYDNGDGVAIMTNGMNGGRLAEELVRTIALAYHWPDFAPIKRGGNGPSPGLEAAIQRELNGDLAGKPALEIMSPTLQTATQQQWPMISANAKSLGAVQAITFQETNSRGWDVYHVTFANGSATVQAAPLTDGKLSGILHSDILLPQQPQHPGTEASLRRYIESLEKGQPNYDEMAPRMAAVVKQQLPDILAMIKPWGALQSIDFKGGGPQDMDVYEVTFEHAKAEWDIAPLDADGKVVGRGFHQIS
jgi:CubicO group peptidase (beta-lactamase class C family)